MKKFAMILAVGLTAAGAAQAFWYGNPGRAQDAGGSSLGFIYGFGDRDIETNDIPGRSFELHTRTFAVEYRVGLAKGFEAMVRGVPATTRMNVEGYSFNPTIWGGGAGLHWAPPEKLGVVNIGILGVADVDAGAKKSVSGSGHDTVGSVTGAAAAGVSVSLLDKAAAYGGLSVSRKAMTVEINKVDTDWENADTLGAFLGAEFTPNEAWALGAEVHFSNEQALALALTYSF